MYGKIVDETIRLGLPHTGIMSDGRTVSGYHLLDEETPVSRRMADSAGG